MQEIKKKDKHYQSGTMEFNEKLQELRKQKGLTQEELAEKLYVSRTAISKRKFKGSRISSAPLSSARRSY